jgi:peptidoglycan/LPS O-acetylase OafA/YrhL
MAIPNPSDRPLSVAGGGSRHVLALDGVRGLAIIAVMLHHFTVAPDGGARAAWLARLAEFGAQGVDLFFVLSGFLITAQLLGPRLNRRRMGRFYVRRALRIVPLYYAILLFVYLLLPIVLRETGFPQKLAEQTSASSNWPWYGLFISNFRNALDGRFTNPALDVSWSLAIEMQFYLVWPWVVRWCSRRVLKRIIWTIILASPFLRAFAWAMGANWIQILVLPFLRADILLWGALLAIWLDERAAGSAAAIRSLARVGGTLLWLLPLIVTFLLAGEWNRQNWFTSTIGYSLVGLAAAGICARVLTMPPRDGIRRLFENRGLVFISSYAYGLYLMHVPIRAMIRDVVFSPASFNAWPVAPLTGQLVFYGLAAVVSLLPAAVVWHLWESPFIQLGHRLTTRTTRSSSLASPNPA